MGVCSSCDLQKCRKLLVGVFEKLTNVLFLYYDAAFVPTGERDPTGRSSLGHCCYGAFKYVDAASIMNPQLPMTHVKVFAN